jgi:DNA polymerase-3 subunit delta
MPKAHKVQAIVGEDTYLAEAALERVLAAAVGSERQDSLRVLYGDEAKWEDVVAAARSGSLFAASRAVLVRRAELLKYASAPQDDEAAGDAKGKSKSKTDSDPVEAYLESPAPDATLIVMAAKPDKRRRPWKALLAKAETHDCAPRRGRALRVHVEQELRGRGLRFSREALDLLIEEVGQDLRRLMGEVDKLEAWAEGRKEIGEDDVSSLLGRGLAQPLYLLSDAFAARDAAKTLELLDRLLGDGEAGLRVLVTLHRALRQVRSAVALREAGLGKPQIGAKLLPPNMQFKVDALYDASRRWSGPDLARATAQLTKIDREIKQGADEAVALAAAIAAACGPRTATSPRRAS